MTHITEGAAVVEKDGNEWIILFGGERFDGYSDEEIAAADCAKINRALAPLLADERNKAIGEAGELCRRYAEINKRRSRPYTKCDSSGERASMAEELADEIMNLKTDVSKSDDWGKA